MRISQLYREFLYRTRLESRPEPEELPEDSLAASWRRIRNDAQEQERQYYFYTSRHGRRAINRMVEAEFDRQREGRILERMDDEVEEIVRPVRRRAEVVRNEPPIYSGIFNAKKLTDEQLLEELTELYQYQVEYEDNYRYALKKRLFKRDYKTGYKRRSFKDLFLFFRRKGVTERQLMRVLGHPNSTFVGFRCPDIQQMVFYRELIPRTRKYKFSSYNEQEWKGRLRAQRQPGFFVDQYNFTKLGKLYDEIYG